MRNILFLFFLIFILNSCSFTPKYKKPDIPIPNDNISIKNYPSIKWWEKFNDSNLNAIINLALKNNEDIKLAIAKIKEAEALYKLSLSNQYPVVMGKGSTTRYKTSDEASIYKKGLQENNFLLSSSVSYELDLWGKLKNATKVKLSQLLAEKYNRDIIKISLISSICENYINLGAVNEELKIAENTKKTYYAIYKYRLKQYRNGLIDELTVNQAKAEYEATKVLIQQLKEERSLFQSTILELTGVSPKKLFEISKKTGLNWKLPKDLSIPPFLPSKLLENRPDIRKAEELLIAANFNIGVAKAKYFPQVTLTGILGLESRELHNLIQSSAKEWSIGSNISQIIFDFGRTSSNVRAAKALKKEAIINYIKTVKNAFKEVYDNLNKIEYTKNKLQAEKEYLASIRKVLDIARKKYKIGLVDYLTVLDAQRHYLSAQLNVVKIKAELLKNKILFYKSLGI